MIYNKKSLVVKGDINMASLNQKLVRDFRSKLEKLGKEDINKQVNEGNLPNWQITEAKRFLKEKEIPRTANGMIRENRRHERNSRRWSYLSTGSAVLSIAAALMSTTFATSKIFRRGWFR
jgi:hypothetical protein